MREATDSLSVSLFCIQHHDAVVAATRRLCVEHTEEGSTGDADACMHYLHEYVPSQLPQRGVPLDGLPSGFTVVAKAAQCKEGGGRA